MIENVMGAPLVNPVTLCGTEFGLGVARHRLFVSIHARPLGRALLRAANRPPVSVKKCETSWLMISGGGYNMDDLIEAIKHQTEAINALIESNQRLMMLLIDSMAVNDHPAPRAQYMDGSSD